MAFFLGCLALLHYWWFYLIGQMLLTIVFKGQLVDYQQKVADSASSGRKKSD
jgi:hypothetical protein